MKTELVTLRYLNGETVTFEVTVSPLEIAKALGNKARRSKGGKSGACNGGVVVRVVKP